MDKLIEGKTKVLTIHSEDRKLVKVTTKDSLTGNDGELKSELPLAKAKTEQTCNVFQVLKSAGIPVAYVEKVIETENEFISKQCNMIPLECVMRRKPWGSYLKRHPMNNPLDVTFESPIAEFYYKVVDYPFKSKTHITSKIETEGATTTTRMVEEPTGEKYTDPIIYTYDRLMLDASHTHESVWPSQDWYLHPPKMRFSPKNFEKFTPFVDYQTMEYIENELMRPTFRLLEGYWKKFKVDLIDLKIEVGYTVEDSDGGKNNIGKRPGKLVVADVIDNDSWRIWPNGDNTNQLDKQLFREGGSEEDVIHNYEKVADMTNRMREWFYRVGG